MLIGTIVVNSMTNGLPLRGGTQFFLGPFRLKFGIFAHAPVHALGGAQALAIIGTGVPVFSSSLGIVGHGRHVLIGQLGAGLVLLKIFIVRVNAPLARVPTGAAGFEVAASKHDAQGFFFSIAIFAALVLSSLPARVARRRRHGGFFFGERIAVNVKHHTLFGIFFGLFGIQESHTFFVQSACLFIFHIQGIVWRDFHPPQGNLGLVAFGATLLLTARRLLRRG
mmetsp:Transcript_13147/g.29884  ORF Transcript_13147/g.29884 Transcript_13147/m.29884 type:complete len:224 (+) Transcript_13147:433-1104(+)